MEITKKRLEAYRSEKQEIMELRHKLNNLKEEDFIESDVIMDYRSGFPVPQSIVGINTNAYWKRKERLITDISRLERRCQETELWIDEIQDSAIRRIFRLYYEDGQGQQAIARQLHMDQSMVSRKINRYIDICHGK